LPRGDPPSADVSEEGRETASTNDTIKVLYVEDSDELRRVVGYALPQMHKFFPTAGWPFVEVIEAKDGLAGVAKAKEHLPDVIVLDLWMPKVNGIEAAIQIRDDPQTSHIPIIILSVFDDERVQDAARQAGAERLVCKPFQWDELMKAIVEVAGTRR